MFTQEALKGVPNLASDGIVTLERIAQSELLDHWATRSWPNISWKNKRRSPSGQIVAAIDVLAKRVADS